MPFELQIVSPEKKLFIGQVKKVIIPAVTGQLTILSHHTALFTSLKEGVIKLVDISGKNKLFSIGKGMIEVGKEKAILLVEPPESADRITKQKEKEARKQAQKINKGKLKTTGKINTQSAFRRSLIDLKNIKRKKRKSFIPSSNSN